MKKLDIKKLFLMLLIIFAISLGNIQIFSPAMIPESDNSTEIKSSAIQANIGAWIIIGGDRSDHDKVAIVKQGCDMAHFILRNRGFAEDDIYNLGPAWSTSGFSVFQEEVANYANIEDAITNWAASKVDATRGLGIYMFDHGGANVMPIPGSPELTDSDLNNWLNELETNTGCNRVYIIYEACHAGSFIYPVSKNNRIVITSTDIANGAHSNPEGTWTVFSEAFFSSIIGCKTIGECFEDGVAAVRALSYADDQFPLIDDNHDEVGHGVDINGNLPNGGDGSDALNVWIGTGSNCPLTIIQYLPIRYFVRFGVISAPIWMVVENFTTIEKVYVRVMPPYWVPPEMETDDEGSKLITDTGVLIKELIDPDGDGNFTGDFEFDLNRRFWNMNGDYKLTFHARSQDGTVAAIESSYITLNNDGTAPTDTTPPTIAITNPQPANLLNGTVEIIAEGDDDQALDKIQIYIDGKLVKEESMPPNYPYPEVIHSFDTSQYSAGAHVITAIATDKANNNKSTTVAVIFSGTSIPSYNIPILMFGSVIGVILIYLKKIKKRLL